MYSFIKNINIQIGSVTIKKRHLIAFLLFLLSSFFGFKNKDTVLMFFEGDIVEKTIIEKDTIYITPKVIHNSITLNWKETAKLNRICEKLRVKYKSSYVNVNAFHNGDSTAGGWHFAKMTCIGEGLEEDKPPQLGALKNWHTGAFSESFLECNEMGYLYVPDLTKHKNAYLSKTIPEFGIYSVVYVAVLDKRYVDEDGLYHMPGFISFAWDRATTEEDVTVKDIKAMILETHRVKKYLIKH